MIPDWKKLLASFLIKCKIISKEWSGEINLKIDKGGISWLRKTETIK